jgi:hypothetical protein
MLTSLVEHRRKPHRGVGRLFAAALAIAAPTASATTHLSAEPIPTADVIGQEDLDKLESVGYSNLELWAQRLLDECLVVDQVIDALTDDGVISTITPGNTSVVVAAGGFEAVTNPSFVSTIDDTGCGAADQADVDVLSSALGYVLSQGGTAHFSPDDHMAYWFALDYAVVTFSGTLTGEEAKAFFDHVGTVDAALWSGMFAGFTQIDFDGSPTNNSMLFLQPAVSKNQFVAGLFAAANSSPEMPTYSPTKPNGQPTTARAGIAFPENDWVAFPGGDQYLATVGGSAQLVADLAEMRDLHLTAVENLVEAIDQNDVEAYLDTGFSCPN